MRVKTAAIAALAIGAVLAAAGVSSAQKGSAPPSPPPPPVAIPPRLASSNPCVPHLLTNRLDYSFCQYPMAARRAHLEGCCRMKVEVAADGAGRVLGGQCTDDVFMPPARDCLAPQSYVAARPRGKPAKGVGEIVVLYKLEEVRLSPLDTLLGALFGNHPRPKPAPTDESDWDICKKKPDDMISSLTQKRG